MSSRNLKQDPVALQAPWTPPSIEVTVLRSGPSYPQCLLGPIAVADDDGTRTPHGADVLQSGSTADGDSGHSKVLNR